MKLYLLKHGSKLGGGWQGIDWMDCILHSKKWLPKAKALKTGYSCSAKNYEDKLYCSEIGN